jgi:hypothetical protein
MSLIQTLKRRLKQKYNRFRILRAMASLEATRRMRRHEIEKGGHEQSLADLAAREVEELEDEQELFKLDLFSAVGKALTSWALLEEMVVNVFSMLNRSTQTKAGAILYSIINFNTWLSITTDLFAQDELYGSFRPRWNKLSSRMRTLKDTRDRIAHHSAVVPDTLVEIVALTSLKPSLYDTRPKSLKYSPLTTDQIAEFSYKIADVLRGLEDMIDEMKKVSDTHLRKMEIEFSDQYEAERAAGRSGHAKDDPPPNPPA